MYESIYHPTRLYIKEINGIKYFGKYTKDDIYEYNGSGELWNKHIKKYGKPKTLWVSDWFTDPNRIKRFALLFSHLNKIVESSEWANLKPENGLDGGDTSKFIDYSKIDYASISHKRSITINKIQKNGLTLAKNTAIKSANTMKNGIRKSATEKMMITKSSEEWKNTIGKESVKKSLMNRPDDFGDRVSKGLQNIDLKLRANKGKETRISRGNSFNNHNNPKAKRVITESICFLCCKYACEYFDISLYTLNKRIKSSEYEWSYL